MRNFLSQSPPPTAVMVINDFSAMGALRAAKGKGYRVPEDISLVGFGDVPFSSLTDPPLSTVREPFQEMGLEAAGMLLRIVQGKRLSSRHPVLPVQLVIRESTAPPGRKAVSDRSKMRPFPRSLSPRVLGRERGSRSSK